MYEVKNIAEVIRTWTPPSKIRENLHFINIYWKVEINNISIQYQYIYILLLFIKKFLAT